MLKENSEAKTPLTQMLWNNLSNKERIALVNNKIKGDDKFKNISLYRATKKGQVIVTLDKYISAGTRGVLLLDFECYLKDNIDQGINVWCEPIGDKNSLRNLRGIELKS
jgi:hypothetical protein